MKIWIWGREMKIWSVMKTYVDQRNNCYTLHCLWADHEQIYDFPCRYILVYHDKESDSMDRF